MPRVSKQRSRPIKRKKPTKKKRRSTGSKIQELNEGFSEGLKINLYGLSGTGKTTLWATFPGKILCLVCSSIKNSGELRSVNTKEYRRKIKKWNIDSSEEIDEVMEYLITNPGEFSTVVLDHASGLQDLILKELLGLEEAPVQLSWGLATQQQWGQVAIQMKERLRSLLCLPNNVVIIAQERAFNTEGGGDLLLPNVASALSPSVVGWLNPAVDYICQTYLRPEVELVKKVVNKLKKKTKTIEVPTGRSEYCLRVAPDEVYTTKFRMPRGTEMPDAIVDPSYDKIMELIGE